MEVTASNRPATNGDGSMDQKGLEVEGESAFLSFKSYIFFMEFDSSEEANWVMENGSRIFRGKAMNLKWWNPSTGCTGRKDQAHEAWIKVVGLPLHLWTG